MIDLLRRALTQLRGGVSGRAGRESFGIHHRSDLRHPVVPAGGKSFDRHGVAKLATWFMTLLMQRAEHRDTQAIQAKLDELIHAQGRASNAMTRIDDEQPEDIERHRKQVRKDD